MLKVLYLPLGEQSGMYDAWNNVGVNLSIYDYWSDWQSNKSRDGIKNKFLTKVREFQPNLIHMQLQFTGLLDNDALRQARNAAPGVVITNWSGDCRTSVPGEFSSIAGALDHSLISSTGQLEMYRGAGCHNVKYWQIGYDPKVSFPLNKTEFQYDVSFTGNAYKHFPDSSLRASAVHAVKTAFGARCGIFGSGYSGSQGSTSHQQNNDIYNSSLCVLSISNFNNVAHYFSDRLLLCLGSGRPVISWYFPNCEDYFVDGKDIFIARSNQDIIDIVNRCKADPEMASQVGKNGHKKASQEHTYTSRVIELLNITNLTHLV
jgi:hypothetical protein